MLQRLEHAHRSAVENHVHSPPRWGGRRSLNLSIGITYKPGCVVWWPVHGYEVVCDSPIAEWPEDLLRREEERRGSFQRPTTPIGGTSQLLSPNGRTRHPGARVRALLNCVETAAFGPRNETLFTTSCTFFELMGEGLMSPPVAKRLLTASGRLCVLPSDEVAVTIDKAFSHVARKCGIKPDGVDAARATIRSSLSHLGAKEG
jgi:hypothetical protein